MNWGRFTQLSGQTILPIAWLATWEALAAWRRRRRGADRVSMTVVAAILCGALPLLHFRVAVFYVPLFVLVVGWELCQTLRNNEAPGRLLWGAVGISALAAGIAAAGLVPTLIVVVRKLLSHPYASGAQVAYYRFPWETVPVLAGKWWLLVLAGLASLVGLARRQPLVIVSVIWVLVLLLLGNAHYLGISWLNLTNLGAVLIMLYLPCAVVTGTFAEALIKVLGAQHQDRARRLIVAATVMACFLASHVRVTEVEPHRYFVTEEDVAAMDWIRDNTDPDATFAVNTYFWLPENPHGTDGGYWIPYFTGRNISAGVMLLSLATPEYQARVILMSEAEERLADGAPAVADLRSLGVDYVYVGAMGDFSGPGLSTEKLSEVAELTLAYHSPRVAVFEIERAQ